MEFRCCIIDNVNSFYRSANTILRSDGRSHAFVMLQLLETHCLSRCGQWNSSQTTSCLQLNIIAGVWLLTNWICSWTAASARSSFLGGACCHADKKVPYMMHPYLNVTLQKCFWSDLPRSPLSPSNSIVASSCYIFPVLHVLLHQNKLHIYLYEHNSYKWVGVKYNNKNYFCTQNPGRRPSRFNEAV